MKKVSKLNSDTVKETSNEIPKTMVETTKERITAIVILNEKVLEILRDRGTVASNLATLLIIRFKPKNKNQFRIFKDHNSYEVNVRVINTNKPVTF